MTSEQIEGWLAAMACSAATRTKALVILRSIFQRARKLIGDHSVRLTFEDGAIGDVSFDESYWTGVFEPLRDPRRFAKVSVEGGTITWPEDGLDMAPEPLYAEARERRVSAAPTR